MIKKSILICGDRSFAANGLKQQLEKRGHTVECFSRGEIIKDGNLIRGNVFEMYNNPYLGDYNIVINFILIKDGSINDNIRYINSLITFCKQNKVDKLFQISSISVYPNGVHYVDETSEIEKDYTLKGGYASIKVAVDNYIISKLNVLKQIGLDVIFIRPGFIIEEGHEVSFNGIVKPLMLNWGILLGDKKTSLPLISKNKLHEAIIKLVESKLLEKKVFLILENTKGTKLDFVKRFSQYHVICLPKRFIKFIAIILYHVKIFNIRHVSLIKGLFKDTYYDASESEYSLQMSFYPNSIAVIGAGAYGSYTIHTLIEAGVNPRNITLIDVGNEQLKDEDGIGYGTTLLGATYTGLKKGRFFGLGGATGKWGGQLLLFTKNDIQNPSQFMHDIIRLNLKYRKKVFQKFSITNLFKEVRKEDKLFVKTGVWLGYFSRNLFSYFRLHKTHIFIKKGVRLSKFLHDGKNINGIEFITKQKVKKYGFYNQYFLCTGAFESNRIILSSNLCEKDKISFSDHLSQRVFEVYDRPIIGGEDFYFRVNGTSLITKRLIGEIDNISFFANPIYNAEFPFFQNLKKILFKKEFNINLLKSILLDFPSIFYFIWNLCIQHRIYVYKGIWHIYIDIENPSDLSYLKLSQQKDEWGINKLDVFFEIPQKANAIYAEAKKIISIYLNKNSIRYKICIDKIHAEKSEDTYHPYGMFLSDSRSIDDFFNHFSNMLVVNTGILPRAGGINTTASCFPIIEEYIMRHYGNVQ